MGRRHDGGRGPRGDGHLLARTPAREHHIAPGDGNPDKIAPAWGVELQPEHFVGAKAAEIINGADAPRPHGTQTSFRIDKTARELEWTIEQAAEHYPLPVMLNGQPVKQKSMLDGCIHTEQWNGMRIGVRRNQDNHWNRGVINFHGHKVNCETLPRVTATRTTSDPPMSWWVVIDVIEGKGLELVLPARQQVVHNDYLDQLIDAAWNTVYRALAIENPADLPYQAWSEAKRRGIALKSAGPRLARWKAARAEEWEQSQELYYGDERVQVRDAEGEALLMTAKLECPDGQVLARTLKAAGLSGDVFAPQKQYDGYAWYDEMARIIDVAIELKSAGTTETVNDVRGGHRSPRTSEPSGITVVVTIDRPKGLAGRRRLPADVALIPESVRCIEEMDVVLAQGHQIDAATLSDLLFDSYFCPDEDAGAENASTQGCTFYRDCRELATGLTGSWEQARTGRLESLARTYLAREVQKNETLRFTIHADRSVEVEIDKAAA